MFGNTETEYPSYYLEDIKQFELSSSNINDLQSVEFCIHAKTMDLSDNCISDLTPLFGLSLLEELNLADNKIECDTLSNLENLQSLDLSNNNIEDVSHSLILNGSITWIFVVTTLANNKWRN
ncbi:MAG: hypothetical protein MZV63_44775 [Marinilabiliales bacterium]|nr:hypothetical protein [Marinilabiliales bacterium]